MALAVHRIRFLPDDREVEAHEGSTLLEAARHAGVYVGSLCDGEGLCGKCRVMVGGYLVGVVSLQ